MTGIGQGEGNPPPGPRSNLTAGPLADEQLLARKDLVMHERARRRRRHHRETVTVPRLRLLGSAGLLLGIIVHNALLLQDMHLPLVIAFAGLQAFYAGLSKFILVRYYRPEARPDLSTLFLAGDVAVFTLAIYASGGDQSWMFAVLCVRVADQIGTSQRRAFSFANLGLALHTGLVLYMAFIERRGFSLGAEMSKVGLVYLLNLYLSLAAGPGESQRKRANRNAELAHTLIGELKRRTAQLEVERARAQAASEAKSAFLANISHEIRTPMAAVLGAAELLLAKPLERQNRDMVETILSSGRSLMALVNDVLDMSKVEAGKLTLELDDLDLDHVLQSALSPMRVLASNKGLALKLETDRMPTRKVRGDALRLKQVLVNLIGNAIKFTPEGHVTLAVSVLDVSQGQNRVRFAVTDTGIGMTAEQLRRVFDAFQQGDPSTTRRFGGTGLGLSICQQLVSLMGGELKVRSEPGRGSTFTFTLELPESATASHAPPAMPHEQAVDLLRKRRPRVLLAEDTEVNRALFARMLQHLGCVVDAVDNGALAVERLTPEHPYDVVLLDWHMPVMDGLEAVARIRQAEAEEGNRRTPIICVTASAFADEVERCRRAGMDEVLSKPLVRSQLERVLCHYTLEPTQRVRFSQRPPPPASEGTRLDLAQLEELAGISDSPTTMLRGLFDDLFRALRAALSELSDSLKTRSGEVTVAQVHALKGGAANLGARLLAARLASLEAALHRGDPEATTVLGAVMAELELTSREVDTALKGMAGAGTASQRPAEDAPG